MAETDWFNKPVENSRELILKEAFKLFLQIILANFIK